jgi:CheY-like chemotaxis protein
VDLAVFCSPLRIDAKIAGLLTMQNVVGKSYMALLLCTGGDAVLIETRRLILENAGHSVIAALDGPDVEKACRSHQFDVAVIGQNTSPTVKERIFRLIRQHSPTAKILELHRPFSDKALPEADAWLAMPTNAPEELAEVVNTLARR